VIGDRRVAGGKRSPRAGEGARKREKGREKNDAAREYRASVTPKTRIGGGGGGGGGGFSARYRR